MKRMVQIFFIILVFSTQFVQGQEGRQGSSFFLEQLFVRLLSSKEDAARILINDSIRVFIDNYSRSDTIFAHRFTNIRNLGQISYDNSRLKILTWNLLLDSSESRYYCYFIHRSGKNNYVNKLESVYREEPIRTDITYTEKDWYGALYYDLREIKKEKETYWILLGIDYGNPSVSRKIIEALSFTPEGGVILGKKLFKSGDVTGYREVFEYSPEAVMSLKFISGKSIVFDHLVPVKPALKGKKGFYAPDYSYDAYRLEKGIWRFESDIDVRNKR